MADDTATEFPSHFGMGIDYDRFHCRARKGEPLHGSLGVLQPFGIGIVEVGGIREQLLIRGQSASRYQAIPSTGTGLFRSLPFHSVLLIAAAALVRSTNPPPELENPNRFNKTSRLG